MLRQDPVPVFEVGDRVRYQYGDVSFSGRIIASGYRLDVGTERPLTKPGDVRYMVQQEKTGILHVYGPKYMTRIR